MTLREQVTRAESARQGAMTAAADAAARAESARESLSAAQSAQKILQELAAAVQANAAAGIAAIVAKCLRAIFADDAYDFRIDFAEKRGKTEARMILLRAGAERDPLAETGGGVVDVVAFALRLAALMLSRPAPRRLLVLDEPLKYLSAEYRPAARELMETLAAELGVQIIYVTHSAELTAGVVIGID